MCPDVVAVGVFTDHRAAILGNIRFGKRHVGTALSSIDIQVNRSIVQRWYARKTGNFGTGEVHSFGVELLLII
jgi:hypothetical protein